MTSASSLPPLPSSEEVDDFNDTERFRLNQRHRIQHLRDACADKSLFDRKQYKEKTRLIYHYSAKYSFSYCKVEKVGSTFWIQALLILENSANVSQDVFQKTRMTLHRDRTTIVSFNGYKRRQSRSILVSRDPYSRLFSAYADKMFLPLFYDMSVNIVQRQRKSPRRKSMCANDITFEEFLVSIIKMVHKGSVLNRHWTPIFTMCNPCGVNTFAVLKQELFSSEIEFVFKEIGISNDEFKAIYSALHDHRAESTIPIVVKDAFLEIQREAVLNGCMNNTEFARRLWVSFQIQGFIKETVSFPFHIVDTESKAATPKFLIDVILQTIKEHPLTVKEMNLQRRRALVNAYSGISKEVIEEIKKIYEPDFVLFDYSQDPPLEL